MTKLCSFRNMLVNKTDIEPTQIIGFSYDPGGYPKTNGVKRVVMLHREHRSN